ncbi:hypothetical protein DFJ74DRAFT_770284 [Hyaloraphidium curvatum]|nr:hypothetical protein DFJ74DRAFT_770284 [Hyaloraphidium curvatum]
MREAVSAGDAAALAALLDDGGLRAIDDRDEDTFTLLHLCAFYDARACAELLLDRGADIEAKNKMAETPLILGCFYSPDVAELLLDRGAREGPFIKGPPKDHPSRLKLVERLKEEENKTRSKGSARREAAGKLREQGNEEFRKGNVTKKALELYEGSLAHMQDARGFNNMAAAKLKLAIAEETKEGAMSKEAYLLFVDVVQDAGKASMLDPESKKAWHRRARGYLGYGDLPRAKMHLKDGLKQFPNDPDLGHLLSELEALNAQVDRARLNNLRLGSAK